MLNLLLISLKSSLCCRKFLETQAKALLSYLAVRSQSQIFWACYLFFFFNFYGSPRLQTPYWLMYLEIAPPLMSQGSTDTVGCPYAWMWNLWARGDDCAVPFCIMDLSILKFSCLWESGRWRGVPGTNTPWMPMDECIQTFLNHSYMFHVTLAQLVPVEVASFDFSS